MTEAATSNIAGHIVLKGFVMIFRGLIAILLGMQIGAFVGLALNLHLDGWRGFLPLAIGAMVSLVYGRKRLWLLFVLVFVTYIAGSFYSRNKIDNFCNSITSATPPSELSKLAKREQVDFRSVPMSDREGMFYGYAIDYFSMGDFACRVEFDSNRIISQKTYTH